MSLPRRRGGQTLIEYALLLGLLTIVAVAILTVMGRKARDTYVTVYDSLVTASVDLAAAAASVPDVDEPSSPEPEDDWWTPYYLGRVGYRSPPLPRFIAATLAEQDLAGEIDRRGGYSDQEKSDILNSVHGL